MSGVFDRAASFHVGQLVRFTTDGLNAASVDVTVIGIGTGNRVTVKYGDVASLTVPATMLAPVEAHARASDPSTSHGAGFEVHVASRRRLLPDDVLAPDWDDPDWRAKYKAFGDQIDAAPLVSIGLPHDGESFTFDTEAEMFEHLAALSALGYHVPARLLAERSDPT